MLTNKQSGFTTMEAILALVIATVITFATYGIYRAGHRAKTPASTATTTQSKSTQAASSQETCTAPADWKEHANATYGYSFSYPGSDQVEGLGLNGDYGSGVLNSMDTNAPKSLFFANVLIWPGGSTLGVDADDVRNAFRTGGIKRVAELSLQLNTGVQGSAKTVGALTPYNMCGSTGWGFKVKGNFMTGFIKDTGSSKMVDEETSFIFAASKDTIYRIEFTSSD